MKRERIEAVWIDHLEAKVVVNTVRALRTISGLILLAQPHWGLSVPLCGALDPIIASLGLQSLSQGWCPSPHSSDHPWTKPTCQSMPGRSQPLPSQQGAQWGTCGFPQWHYSPPGLGSGTGLSAQSGNSPGLSVPSPQGTASSHLHNKEYTQESNL